MKFKIFLSMLMLVAFMTSCDEKASGDSKEGDKKEETTPKAESKAGVYTVDIATSKIAFTGVKTEENGEKDTHTGELKLKEGSLKLNDAGNLTGGDFSVDMLSLINTDGMPEGMKADFEKHLKSADFFDVEKYTTASFSITTATAKEAAGEYTVAGSLAVKGLTKNLTFDVAIALNGEMVTGTSEVLLTNEDLGLEPFPAEITLKVDLNAKK